MTVDPSGAYGGIVHYALVIAMVGGAFILFLNRWYSGRLDMDEEPKMVMMREESDEPKQ